jgi:multicomponent Na+:H+ antiporter subunit C
LEVVEIITVVMFFIAFYGLITGKSVIKGIISIIIMEIAVVMFLLSLGYAHGIVPPIGQTAGEAVVADPLPQALVITAIIIGVAVTAVNLTMLLGLFRQFKTTHWDTLKKMNLE